jgi:hypothetical protein
MCDKSEIVEYVNNNSNIDKQIIDFYEDSKSLNNSEKAELYLEEGATLIRMKETVKILYEGLEDTAQELEIEKHRTKELSNQVCNLNNVIKDITKETNIDKNKVNAIRKKYSTINVGDTIIPGASVLALARITKILEARKKAIDPNKLYVIKRS